MSYKILQKINFAEPSVTIFSSSAFKITKKKKTTILTSLFPILTPSLKYENYIIFGKKFTLFLKIEKFYFSFWRKIKIVNHYFSKFDFKTPHKIHYS